MAYISINPYTGSELKRYPVLTEDELHRKVRKTEEAYKNWSNLPLKERLSLLPVLSSLLEKRKLYFAELITAEMGKPIKQSIAEIEKCILGCEYYFREAEQLLNTPKYKTDEYEVFVVYQPQGVVYGIMPWNFPFWQVIRYIIPNLVLGNCIWLKHASNVPQCAEAIEKLFMDAGFPEGVMQNLFVNYEQSEWLIAQDIVCGVSVTGSENAGSRIAEIAGRNICKTVLELGGSDPFIVLEDVNIEKVTSQAVFARMQNAGQSCIASKRFFVHNKIFDSFVESYCDKLSQLQLGDPMDLATDIGPMANLGLLSDIENQVKRSVEMGASVICGGKRYHIGNLIYEPTILTTENIHIPVCQEETFGPVAVVVKFDDYHEMIEMVNSSRFGLGASVWSENTKLASEIALKIQSGMVTINGIVKSHPAHPFGGIKKSGYGRELAAIGLTEFANAKTVTIHYIN